jgi:hypothetical protein
MKILGLVVGTLLSVSAFAKAPVSKASGSQKICAALEKQADEECVSIMCDDSIADGTFKDVADCTSADDYAEAAQGACEDLNEKVDEYNTKHHSHLICQE